ncbi:MAG: hypothetical protein GXO75_02285 [Calditrichaeota bacterium]|nr:hypothetical protein [Calditrichota bacterium]
MESDISIFKKTNLQESDNSQSLQEKIEEQMKKIVDLGNYESVFLFDQEGLQLAQYAPRGIVEQVRVIEISLMIMELNKTVRDLAGITDLKEVIVEGEDGKRIIFRFIPFYGQTAIFVAVIPRHKSYRSLTNRLQRAIIKLGSNAEASF